MYRHYIIVGHYFIYTKKNIKPVIISTLTADGTTLGPNKRRKRQSGRPEVKRTRFRSKFDKPEDSNVTCQTCTENGHNS